MNLFQLLQARAAEERPARVGLIGCGKFATMYLAQARQTHGIHIAGIADLDLVRARANLAAAGWPDEQYQAASLGAALTSCLLYKSDAADE